MLAQADVILSISLFVYYCYIRILLSSNLGILRMHSARGLVDVYSGWVRVYRDSARGAYMSHVKLMAK